MVFRFPRVAAACVLLFIQTAALADAKFSWTPIVPDPGQAVQFKDESVVPVKTWQWTFGDGGSSGERNPVHTYAAAGEYNVTLKITSTSGGSASLTSSIRVSPGWVTSISPAVISTVREGNWLPLKTSITGSKFTQGMTVAIAGATIGEVKVLAPDKAEVTITDVDPTAAQGDRDVTGATAKGAFFPVAKNLVYLTNLGVIPEINQGAIVTCSAANPCLADHGTVLRIRVRCNGANCEAGRNAVRGRLLVYRNGKLVPSPVASPETLPVLPLTRNYTLIQRGRAEDALNYRFSGERNLDEATYDFAFEIDPKKPLVAPVPANPNDPPNETKNLVRRVSAQPFRKSPAAKGLRFAVFVEGNAAADVARALAAFDYMRAAYPVSADGVLARFVPSSMKYRPGSCLTEHCTMVAFGQLLHNLNASGTSAYTNIMLFTRHSGFASDENKGVTFCAEDAGGTKPLRCVANVSIINLAHSDYVGAVAHETGHTLLFGDTYGADGSEGASRSSLNPFTSACAALDNGCPVEEGFMNTTDLTVSAFDAATPGAVGRLKRDVMGNAATLDRWINRTMWDALYRNRFKPAAVSLTAESAGVEAEAEVAAEAEILASDILTVSGLLSATDAVSELSTQRWTTTPTGTEPPPGPYIAELRDAAGAQLAAESFGVSFRLLHGAANASEAPFLVNLPYKAGARRVVLRRGGTELASRLISANAPSVQFVSPTGGSLSGTVNVKWTGTDADGDPLTYTLFYSRSGEDWLPIDTGIRTASYDWQTAMYPGSSAGRLKLVASDGVNQASAVSAPFRLAEKAPIVAITAPFDGAAVPVGTPLRIHGVAYDPQTGNLPDSALSYRSSVAGELGTGRSLTAMLPKGRHAITLTVTAAGKPVTHSINVEVFTPANELRVVPAAGSTPGSGGSFFKTAVQLHNPSATAKLGRFVYHRGGVSGSAADPSLAYELRPGETRYYADLLPHLGTSGLGSVDLIADYGGPPASVIRIFNDAGVKGTSGMTEELFRREDALRKDDRGILIAPIDPQAGRFNIGIRTLEDGATLAVTVFDKNGVQRGPAIPKPFPASFFSQTAANDFLGLTLAGSDVVSITVTAGSAVIYGATTDNKTQDPSLQYARTLPKAPAAGSETRVLPVVGSVKGAGGSFFKTALQVHNPWTKSISGSIVYRPQGGAAAAPFPFTLAAGKTLVYADLLPAAGQTGLGSADVTVTGGFPVTVVRIFNDGGAAGTSGMSEELVRSADALQPGDTGVLILPPDAAAARFNVGIRTLGTGASLLITVRDSNGQQVAAVPKSYPANHFEQPGVQSLLGFLPEPNATLAFTVNSGNAIVYGATTDNKTQDPSLQLAKRP